MRIKKFTIEYILLIFEYINIQNRKNQLIQQSADTAKAIKIQDP